MRGRSPHLAAIDDVFLAVPDRLGLDPGGIQARIGLGHTEAGAVLTRDQGWQQALFLFIRAMHYNRIGAEDIDMHGGAARKSRPRFGDGLHHQRSLDHAQARAAIFFRHGDAQPSAIRQILDEVLRKFAIRIAGQPIGIVIFFA